MPVWSVGWADPLEEEMTTDSSILPWRIPRTEEPDGLLSLESQRVGHDRSNLAASAIAAAALQKLFPPFYLQAY